MPDVIFQIIEVIATRAKTDFRCEEIEIVRKMNETDVSEGLSKVYDRIKDLAS